MTQCVETNSEERLSIQQLYIDGHLNIVKFYVECLHCPPDVPEIFDATTVITPMQLAVICEHNDIVQYLKTVLLVQSGINFYSIYIYTWMLLPVLSKTVMCYRYRLIYSSTSSIYIYIY